MKWVSPPYKEINPLITRTQPLDILLTVSDEVAWQSIHNEMGSPPPHIQKLTP